MKTVFADHRETCKAWAFQSQEHGRSSDGRVFFEGRTIYSYGYHFPMAQFVTNDCGERAVLIRSDGPSVSTKRHLSLVSGALRRRGITLLYVADLPPYNNPTIDHGRNIAAYQAKRDEALKKADRARKYGAVHRGDAAWAVYMGNKYCSFFGLSDRLSMPETV